MASNQDYRDFGVALARLAAKIMREHFSIGGAQKEIKDDHSPVTIADTAINSLVIKEITAAYPEHTILGEEESHGDHTTAEFTWVVDPIDGTRPYSMGVPTSVFSLALTQDGQPIVAVVYDPWMDRMYTAVKGEGAYINDTKMSVSDTTEISQTTHYALASYRRPWKFPVMNELERRGAKFMSTGSFVGESMLVALGQYDIAIFAGSTAHDVATAKLMIEEAGGIATDLAGKDQRYDAPVNGLIASTKALHPQVTKIITEEIREHGQENE